MASHSFAGIPETVEARQIYPENFHGEEGAYVDLEHGRVRYWFKGPVDGRKVALVCGLSVPSLIWDSLTGPLVESGYRVLIYDLYGRGYSEAPNEYYTAELFTTQLASLLKHVGWEKAIIVGLSMGGGIAAAFAAAHPEMIDGKVALLAPAGLLRMTDTTLKQRALTSRLASTVLSSALIRAAMRARPPKLPVDSAKEDGNISIVVQQQASYLPGFLGAISSSFLDGPILDTPATRAAFSACSNSKVLLIWGTSDNVVPYSYHEEAIKLIGKDNLTFVSIDGASHDLTTTRAKEVNEAVLAFLAE